jgi:hypothetical protein
MRSFVPQIDAFVPAVTDTAEWRTNWGRL